MRVRRFIPTCVGNSSTLQSLSYAISVHPHVRGEQASKATMPSSRLGSSPPAWGTGAIVATSAPLNRFIPTRVGNSCCTIWLGAVTAVHPHTRGEQINLLCISVARYGSSPRAWGTGPQAIGFALLAGFIPTRVGNRQSRPPRQPAVTVHPHARGEQGPGDDRALLELGSSPRAWGTDALIAHYIYCPRSIPTRVGNREQE